MFVLAARLGQHPEAQCTRQCHHRQIHQQHRTPVVVLEQHPGDGGAQRRTRGTAGAPDPDRAGALMGVGEHGAQQRQGRRHQAGAGHALQHPGRDQQPGGRRHRRRGRGHTEGQARDEQQPFAAHPVAQVAHGDQQAGEHERVDVADPEDLGVAGAQFRGERRHRDADHGAVDGDHEDRQAQHEQRGDLPPGHRLPRPFQPLRCCRECYGVAAAIRVAPIPGTGG